MTLDLTTRRPREAMRAQRAFASHADPGDAFGHRKLHAELKAGNPFAHALLARRGLTYRDGAITTDCSQEAR